MFTHKHTTSHVELKIKSFIQTSVFRQRLPNISNINTYSYVAIAFLAISFLSFINSFMIWSISFSMPSRSGGASVLNSCINLFASSAISKMYELKYPVAL